MADGIISVYRAGFIDADRGRTQVAKELWPDQLAFVPRRIEQRCRQDFSATLSRIACEAQMRICTWREESLSYLLYVFLRTGVI